MTPAELPAYLQALTARIRDEGPTAAANAMAQAYQGEVVRSMHGPAPSPPGTPPARRSGTLARSVRPEPAVPIGAGRAKSSVAPHTVYARIQQLGGDIHVVRAKVLTDGKTFFGKHVYLPPRPYMIMTAAYAARVHRAAVDAIKGLIG